MLGAAATAQANPGEGEARSLLRDADRIETRVAGEADGSHTVQNAANLAQLRSFSGVVDFAMTSQNSQRRGSGIGVFAAYRLPFQILAIGLGYQHLIPNQPPQTSNTINSIDNPYNKFSLAFALPLMRWIPGFSIGLTYHRLFSVRNFWAAGVDQVDLSLSWWANRFVALGFVARGLNAPRVYDGVPDISTPPDEGVALPVELDPEIAFRPFGNRVFEIGVGARIAAPLPDTPRLAPYRAQPRLRANLQIRGVGVFAEGELYRHNMPGTDREGFRFTAGLSFDLHYVGFAGGLNMATGGGVGGVHGGVGRLRISSEAYPSAVPTRPRIVSRFPMAKYGGDRGMFRFVRRLDRLSELGADTVLVETSGMGLSFAQTEEVREALLRFQAQGGKVVVYLEGGKLKHYFLASIADRIISHPLDDLNIVGIAGRTLYYGDLLEKLGAKAEFVRIAEYKGTPDTYTSNTASTPVARQRAQLYGDVWNHVIRLIAQARGQDPQTVVDLIDSAPYRPAKMVEQGWIDSLAWPEDVDEDLEAWLGRSVRIQEPVKPPLHGSEYGVNRELIAVLHVSGDIATGPSLTIPLLNRRIVGSATIIKEIKRLRNDRRVKGIVVRVSSPGGSVKASYEIAHELDRTREVKPVVISMGSSCASGGYYVATGGDYIYADAATITGSIGIFLPKVDLSGFLEKFGVGVDIVQFGDNATVNSWFKPYSEAERETAMRGISEDYETFVDRVAKARNMTVEEVDEVARGRVFSGARAIEVGLVDSYGGLREAVMRAELMAGLAPGRAEVAQYPKPPGLIAQLRTLFGLKIDLPIGGAGRLQLPVLPSSLRRVLEVVPATLWLADRPEALALDMYSYDIEG